jgi:hypothetical protein
MRADHYLRERATLADVALPGRAGDGIEVVIDRDG